jgi:serine/threonine protein kinase
LIIRNSSNKPIQIENYKVLSQLGRGGFGTIFHVSDVRNSSKEYALKFLKTNSNIKRIQKQLAVLKILNTSKLFLQTYLSKKVLGNLFLLMEYSKDLSLEKLVKKETFSDSLTCEFLFKILDSLEFLHKNGIIHGDIKAENILKKEDRFYLIDFNVVKTESPSKTIHIQSDNDFTAPEIYRGIQTYLSDIYSLGCVIYYMLSAKHIYGFKNKNDFSTKMFSHLYSEPIPDAKISKKMFYLIKRMTDKNYKTRASLTEVREILRTKTAFDKITQSYKSVKIDNYPREFDRYKFMSDNGVSYAQNIFGLIHEEGINVKKDLNKAVELYQLSADQGLAKAQFNLALSYKMAKGCEQNYSKAIELFTYASNQEHNRSFYHLADMYERGLGFKTDMDKAIFANSSLKCNTLKIQ